MIDPELERLIDNLNQSLQRELHTLRDEIHGEFADMKARFDRQDARLERHGGLLQGGARSVTRMIAWSEEADRQWAERDARIRQLEDRVKRLEGKEG